MFAHVRLQSRLAEQGLRSPKAPHQARPGIELTPATLAANSAAHDPGSLVGLNLGLEQLGSLGHALVACRQLRVLTLSNNQLTSLAGN